jgi:tetratricopeptide (TPR) repeat protein
LRDESPATIHAALPTLRAIADATQAPHDLAALARTLAGINPAEAEALLRASLARAAAAQDFRLASGAAGTLTNLLSGAGRLREALDLANQSARYSRQGGLGPWDQLADRAQVLQLFGQMGQHREVLDEIPALRDQMDKLPATKANHETVEPWNVREAIFDIGRSSAQALEEWQQCLDLNAAVLASKRARGADAYEILRSQYNDARPLMELGRLADAERLLLEVQQAYEDQGDIDRLQQVLSTRALLEDTRRRPQQALELERTAIRLTYIRPVPRDIAISHYQLALYLRTAGSDAAARAHLLAAVLLFQLTGMTHNFALTSRALASQLRKDTERADLPDTLDEVVRVAEQTEGVHLDQLIAAMQPDRQAVADALAGILRAAADADPSQDPAIQRHLEQWEPVIAATVAAASGYSDTAAQLSPVLDRIAQDSDWAALVAVLRRIIDGERDDSLLQGLDSVDTAIAGQVLTQLAEPPDTSPREGS